jgi:hypothetical protein
MMKNSKLAIFYDNELSIKRVKEMLQNLANIKRGISYNDDEENNEISMYIFFLMI